VQSHLRRLNGCQLTTHGELPWIGLLFTDLVKTAGESYPGKSRKQLPKEFSSRETEDPFINPFWSTLQGNWNVEVVPPDSFGEADHASVLDHSNRSVDEARIFREKKLKKKEEKKQQ